MQMKLFEIRDRATLVPALAVRLSGSDGPLVRRAGVGDPIVILTKLESAQSHSDPFEWRDRTMHTAHLWLEKEWGSWQSGDVLDVEYLLRERSYPKESEFK